MTMTAYKKDREYNSDSSNSTYFPRIVTDPGSPIQCYVIF